MYLDLSKLQMKIQRIYQERMKFSYKTSKMKAETLYIHFNSILKLI